MQGLNKNWQAQNPVKLVFGRGSLVRLPELARGNSILLLTTPGSTHRGLTQRVSDLIADRNVTVHDKIASNIELNSLESIALELKNHSFDEIVAVGGGSVIDTAKVLSQLLPAPDSGALRNHLEGAVTMLAADRRLPIIAVPTTAGTGAEVTPFATVWDKSKRVKHSFSLGDPYPDVALLDPELTTSMPADVTLTTGLDALCQGLESLWSVGSNPVSYAYAQRAVQISLEALPAVMREQDDLSLRSSMMEASLLAGLAISISRTTLSHSISYPLTLHFDVPHGLACAFTIVQVLRFNHERHPGAINDIARYLGTGNAEGLANRIFDLLARSGAYERLSSLTHRESDVLAVAAEGITSGRSDNNPRPASVADIEQILTEALRVARDHTS